MLQSKLSTCPKYTPLIATLLAILSFFNPSNNAQAVERSNAVKAVGSSTGYLQHGGLTWMPNAIIRAGQGAHWAAANTYCTKETINGQTGWRLPTKDELVSLYSSVVLVGKPHWTTTLTWSSTPYGPGMHYIAGQSEAIQDDVGRNLGRYNVSIFEREDGVWFAVTCVR